MTTSTQDQTADTIEKDRLIELIAKNVWEKNTRLSPAEVQRQKLSLQGFPLAAVKKTAKQLLPRAFDQELGEKIAGNGMSIDQINGALSDLVDNRFQAFEGSVNKKFTRLITESLPIIHLKINDLPVVNLGVQHDQFKKLLALCMTKSISGPLNVWLTGPAGSGKTKAAESVSKALKIPFHFNGAIDTEYKLSGFVDAQGKIVSTAFRKAYETGGVYLFDEVDASLPAALLAFNAALANGYADFPGEQEPINRHPDCVIIAAANTWGTGPNSEYVGRNKLDAAFLDRFVQLAWGYDNQLERILANHDSWVDYVQTLRENVIKKGIKAVISPRASITGGAMLKTGYFSVEEVVNMTIKKGMSADNWATATNGISLQNIDPSDGGRFEITQNTDLNPVSKRLTP